MPLAASSSPIPPSSESSSVLNRAVASDAREPLVHRPHVEQRQVADRRASTAAFNGLTSARGSPGVRTTMYNVRNQLHTTSGACAIGR